MVDISHRIGIACDAGALYKAVSSIDGFRKWWTRDTAGSVERGGIMRFRFPNTGPDFEVREMTPDKLVRLKCVLGHEEWVNTDLTFEIIPSDGETILNLTHGNWKEVTDMYRHCNTKWGVFMLSLKRYLEEGKGYPHPDDIGIGSHE